MEKQRYPRRSMYPVCSCDREKKSGGDLTFLHRRIDPAREPERSRIGISENSSFPILCADSRDSRERKRKGGGWREIKSASAKFLEATSSERSSERQREREHCCPPQRGQNDVRPSVAFLSFYEFLPLSLPSLAAAAARILLGTLGEKNRQRPIKK